jgi:hypothetical protein
MDKSEFVWRWSEIEPDARGCKIWPGRKDKDGYGIVDYDRDKDGKLLPTRVARLVYRLKVGPIPDGQVIKHSCDNPQCVALEHLELGTYSENNKEGYDRGGHIPISQVGVKILTQH